MTFSPDELLVDPLLAEDLFFREPPPRLQSSVHGPKAEEGGDAVQHKEEEEEVGPAVGGGGLEQQEKVNGLFVAALKLFYRKKIRCKFLYRKRCQRNTSVVAALAEATTTATINKEHKKHIEKKNLFSQIDIHVL